MTMDQNRPGSPGNPADDDTPVAVEDDVPVVEEDWERADAAEAEAGSDGEDVFASEEVEIVAEETDPMQDDDDDDNPYQESDEALPDDKEEAAIRHDLLDRNEERFGD
jgi:hypothetical protein